MFQSHSLNHEERREYFNTMATAWAKTAMEPDYAKLAGLVQRLDIRPGSAVLDAGAGTGVLLPFLMEKLQPGGRLIALDYAAEMIKMARKKFDSGNIEFLHADIASVPLPDALFDTVVCNSCFPHFQNKPAALCEIRRLLKNGGWLFICHTSGRIAINNIHHQTAVLAQDLIPEDNQMYAMMQSAGFEDVVIQDSPDSYLASGRKADG